MAERVIAVKIKIDGKESIEELESVQDAMSHIEESLKDLEKESAKGVATEAFRELNKVVEESALTMGELGFAAEQYKNIAISAGTTSPIGQEALKKAGEMERQMADVSTQVTNLATRGQNLQTALTLGQGVFAGFTAFQGIQATLGVENEELEETFVKLQGAMATLQALQEIQMALSKESIIIQKAQVVWMKAQVAWTKIMSAATKVQTAIQAALNFVMNLNPISLIVIAIGLLVAGFILLKDWIVKTIKEFFDLRTVILLLIGPIGWIILAYEKLFNKVKDEAKEARIRLEESMKAERKAHDERLKQIDKEREAKIEASNEVIKALELEKDTLEAEGKASDEATLKILEAELAKVQAVLDANAQKIQSWIDYYRNLAMLRGESDEQFTESMKKQGIDLEDLQNRANELLEDNQRNIQFAENKITKFKREQLEKQQKDKEKADEKWLEAEDLKFKKVEKTWKEWTEGLQDIEVEGIDTEDIIDFDEMELEAEEALGKFAEFAEKIKMSFKEGGEEMKEEMTQMLSDIADGVQMAMDTFAAVNELTAQLAENRMAENEDRRDEELGNLESQKQAELNQEGLTERSKAIIQAKFAQKEFEIKKKTAEANDKIAKRQFNQEKAFNIAQAVINTASGVLKALGTYGPTPLGIAGMAAAATIGALQIATISATKFEGTASQIQAPSFNIPDAGTGDTGGGAGGGSGTGGGNTQDDTGTNVSDLLQPKLQVSVVEINEVANSVSEVDDISTIG